VFLSKRARKPGVTNGPQAGMNAARTVMNARAFDRMNLRLTSSV
jgi:hypothetical protein